jgi:hypothetical protein
MPIKIKSQKDHLITEAALDPAGTDLNSLDSLMRASKATGKIVAVYNQGGLMNINLDQKSPIPEKFSEQVREILGVGTKEIS